jgi:hypothetical protein
MWRCIKRGVFLPSIIIYLYPRIYHLSPDWILFFTIPLQWTKMFTPAVGIVALFGLVVMASAMHGWVRICHNNYIIVPITSTVQMLYNIALTLTTQLPRSSLSSHTIVR